MIFEAVAQGRLHLSAVIMLKPYLNRRTVNGLVAEATHKSKAEIAQMLAERFPQFDVCTSMRPNGLEASADLQLAPGPVVQNAPTELAPGPLPVAALEPQRMGLASAPSVVAPLSTQRFALQVTIDYDTYQRLCRAQELMSHALPSGDIAQVLDRALDLLVSKLEKRKFGATEKPRTRTRRASKNPRHIPAHVRRAVVQRDGGQCTFVGGDGHRCTARKFLEFDHAEEVARGGVATVANIRLRCSAHNQYQAECAFGAGFMERKRLQREFGLPIPRTLRVRARAVLRSRCGGSRRSRRPPSRAGRR